MVKPKNVSGVDINEDMDFQRREWAVQRVAWAIMAALILAALLGLLGRGPLSRARAGDPSGDLSAEYERLDRYQAPTELRVTAGRGAVSGDELRLTLNREFVDRIQIDSIEPEPETVESAGDDIVYGFAVAEPGQQTEVLFSFQFTQAGRAGVEVGIDGGPQLAFNQFVFP